MLFFSILILLVAMALHSQHISSILFTRIAAIVFIYSGVLSFNAFYIQSIGSGLGIYSGLVMFTCIYFLVKYADVYPLIFYYLFYLLFKLNFSRVKFIKSLMLCKRACAFPYGSQNYKLISEGFNHNDIDNYNLLYSLKKQTPTHDVNGHKSSVPVKEQKKDSSSVRSVRTHVNLSLVNTNTYDLLISKIKLRISNYSFDFVKYSFGI